MSTPQVSVIIPTYNRAEVTVRAVLSVMAQTYRDYEILVVDDGSLDLTEQKMRWLPVRYFRQKHRGAATARNLGIEESRGKYIAFLDSDDTFLPSKLEKQVAAMEANSENIISHTSYIRRSKSVDTPVHSGLFTGHVYPRIYMSCPMAMPTVMVRSGYLKQYDFEDGLHGNDDTILWAKLARIAPVLGIDEALSVVNVGEQTSARNLQHQLQSIPNIINYGINRDVFLPLKSRLWLLLYWNSLRVGFRVLPIVHRLRGQDV